MNVNKKIINKLPAPMKKSELVAKLAALEKARARDKANQKKALIIGAACVGVAAAATAAYMVLRKKEITIQLHCEIEDKKKPLANDACCCTDDEPIEEVAGECCCEEAASEECCCCEAAEAEAEQVCCCCEEMAEEAAGACCCEESAGEPKTKCCCGCADAE